MNETNTAAEFSPEDLEFFNDFDGTTEINERLPYITEKIGTYTLRVDKLKKFEGNSGRTVLGEFTILEAKGEDTLEVGTRVAQVIVLEGKFPGMRKANALKMIGAVINKHPEDVTDKEMAAATSKNNPYKGVVIRAFVYPHEKKDGTVGNLVTFSPGKKA